jgi:polyphenol oxidase
MSMFAYRTSVQGGLGSVEVAFTDSRLDIGDGRGVSTGHGVHTGHGVPTRDAALARLAAACGSTTMVMNQVHGSVVEFVNDAAQQAPTADGLVTSLPSLALVVRVADCVPVLLADAPKALIGAVHAGRVGLTAGVVPAAVAEMKRRGAEQIQAWVGPHICGACYEVPEAMRDAVAEVLPAAYAVTSWGTPSLDIGAGVASQLGQLGCETIHVDGCTLEDPQWPSFRRDGARAGRMAGVIWMSR